MPKPLKSLLIVFSVLIFAGILALVWNQMQRPAKDAVADASASAAGQNAASALQSAESGSAASATADSGTAGQASGGDAAVAAGQGSPASPSAGDQSAVAAKTAGDTGAGAENDKVAAVTPEADAGLAKGTAPGGETEAAAAAAAGMQPSFDVVRVEPSGDTVVAGRAAPNSVVELLSNGSIIAVTSADKDGDFVVVLDKPLAPGGHDLALRTSDDKGVSVYSKTNVAVAVPEVPSGEVLVVMNEPGAASEILAKPDKAASAAPGTEIAATGEAVIAVAPSSEAVSGETQVAASGQTPAHRSGSDQPAMAGAQAQANEPVSTAEPAEAAGAAPAIAESPAQTADAAASAAKTPSAPPVPLAVEAVEVEGEVLYAAGTAKAGEIIRLYIDDQPVGEATSSDNGRWLLETQADVPAGTVVVRADQLAPGDPQVVARAEVPFTRQVDMAVLIPTASSGAAAGAKSEGELPRPNAIIIRRGDNLWTISRRTYGRGIRYTTIYTANKDQIRNPHLIFPGQVFVLPVSDKTWTQ